MAVNPTDCAVEKGPKTSRQENAAMLAPFEISDHPAGVIVSRGTGHTAAGVGAGTAEIKAFNGGAILGRFGMRAQAENLVQAVAPVENNSAVCHDRCTAISESAVSIPLSCINNKATGSYGFVIIVNIATNM